MGWIYIYIYTHTMHAQENLATNLFGSELPAGPARAMKRDALCQKLSLSPFSGCPRGVIPKIQKIWIILFVSVAAPTKLIRSPCISQLKYMAMPLPVSSKFNANEFICPVVYLKSVCVEVPHRFHDLLEHRVQSQPPKGCVGFQCA